MTPEQLISEKDDEIDALKAEIERLQKLHVEDMRVTNASADFHMKRCASLEHQLKEAMSAAGFCDRHQPNGGARNCLVCGCEQMSYALSKISYICGEPNEMQQSEYDVHCNEDAVVYQVQLLIDKLKK